jgi:hypothetical protein
MSSQCTANTVSTNSVPKLYATAGILIKASQVRAESVAPYARSVWPTPGQRALLLTKARAI